MQGARPHLKPSISKVSSLDSALMFSGTFSKPQRYSCRSRSSTQLLMLSGRLTKAPGPTEVSSSSRSFLRAVSWSGKPPYIQNLHASWLASSVGDIQPVLHAEAHPLSASQRSTQNMTRKAYQKRIWHMYVCNLNPSAVSQERRETNALRDPTALNTYQEVLL